MSENTGGLEPQETVDIDVDTGGNESGVEIEVVDDTPADDRSRAPLTKEVADPDDEELQTYSEGVRKRFGELTRARHDERRAKEALMRERQELDRIARALAQENQQLKTRFAAGAKQYGEVAADAAERRLAAARDKLKEAHNTFDTDAIVAAQEELADAKLAWNQAQQFKTAAGQREEPVVQPQQERVQPPPSQVDAQPIDERTLRWQARNQWWGSKDHEPMTLFSLGVHNELEKAGVVPGSDEYFEKIDARLRETFPAFFGVRQQAARRTSSVVAPGNRTSGARKVQITATAMALVKKLGITPQEYAAQVAKLGDNNG